MNDDFDNRRDDKQVLLDTLGDGVRMNQTQADAHYRVLDARMGSVANASDEYLEALQAELVGWLGEITNRRALLLKAANRRAALARFDEEN